MLDPKLVKEKSQVIRDMLKDRAVDFDLDTLIEKCTLDGLMVFVSADHIFDVTEKLIPTKIRFKFRFSLN